VATEQEQELERAKKNAINVKNSTVSKNVLEVNDFCFESFERLQSMLDRYDRSGKTG
jgi:hypothetical protein